MNEELGQEQAFPMEQHDANGLYEIHHGMSKRFYAAMGYADMATKWGEDIPVNTCLSILGLPKESVWDYLVHFPKLVVKLQYILADEFLKQENL